RRRHGAFSSSVHASRHGLSPTAQSPSGGSGARDTAAIRFVCATARRRQSPFAPGRGTDAGARSSTPSPHPGAVQCPPLRQAGGIALHVLEFLGGYIGDKETERDPPDIQTEIDRFDP